MCPVAVSIISRSPAARRKVSTAAPHSGGEHRRPVVLDADDGPAVRLRALERVLGARRVVELALGVVVEDEQPERRVVAAASAASGCRRWSCRRRRSAADRCGSRSAPASPGRRRRRPARPGRRRAAVLVVARSGGRWSCRSPARRDAVDLLGDRAHEVAVAAGGDVGREPVRLQVAQQLDHRHVAAVGEGRVRASGARACRGTSSAAAAYSSTFMPANAWRMPPISTFTSLSSPVVVLGRSRRRARRSPSRTPPSRAGGRAATRPARPSRPAAEDEAELDRHRLLAPERAVVVEDGDRAPRAARIRAALVLDERRRSPRCVAVSFQEPSGSPAAIVSAPTRAPPRASRPPGRS